MATTTAGDDSIAKNSHHDKDSITSMSLSKLASSVCEAMEQGDDACLASLMDITPIVGAANSGTVEIQQTSMGTAVEEKPNVVALFRFFCNLLGRDHDSPDDCLGEIVTYDLSVRAHLVLKAIFRLSTMEMSFCSIAWRAALAAVDSLQFSSYSTIANRPTISHGEGLTIVAEIRSFLSTNVLLMSSALNDHQERLQFVNQTSQRMLQLGQLIIAPLLSASNDNLKDNKSTNTTQRNKRRRQHSYLLPLELIPAILAAADALDDIRQDISDDLSLEENNKRSSTMTMRKGSDLKIENMNHSSGEGNESKRNENIEVYTWVSAKLMTTMFASHTQHSRNSVRPIRAEAVLPVLALAIDDIGSHRMSATVPAMDDDSETYWSCLRHLLNDAITSSIICCTEENDCGIEFVVKCRTLKEEEKSDEGLHIIPHSDFPALIRCIFRMITSTANTLSSVDHSTNPSWESLLLRSYHAAIVTTLTPSVMWSKNHSDMDRITILSTVESHVLLPTFTLASVSSIRSILHACTIECCPSCRKNSSAIGAADSCGFSTICTPAFAVAGVVLLVMRARASSVSYSSKNNGTGFGPRSTFRMASDIIHKKADVLDERNVSGKRVDDEFAIALKVLLNLAGIESGACPACTDVRVSDGAPLAAYEVLKCSYYNGDGTFVPRYANQYDESTAYRHEIGLRTLSSYRRFVHSSLTHGLSLSAGKSSSMESFVADSSRTWLDAATMLLKDTSKHISESRERRNKTKKSVTHDGFALAAVIIIVIFCEVPSSQNDIVRTLYDGLLASALKESCDEACLLIISTLVWSIAAKDGNTSSNDFFCRKKVRQDFSMSVFQPLCSLLSRPVVSKEQNYDRFFGLNEIPPLSYATVLRLTRSLVSIPSCRECILTMSKKHLRSFTSMGSDIHSSVRLTSVFQIMPCTSTLAASRDGLYFAVACLCMLIEKYEPSQSSMLDDSGCEALIILTDMIVLRRASSSIFSPLLPVQVISWILAELKRLSTLSKISVWTSQRLLRASYACLLKGFELEMGNSGGEGIRALISAHGLFSLEGASLTTNIDLVGLLRLANSLHYLVSGNSPKRCVKSQLLSTLLHKDSDAVWVPVANGVSPSMKGFVSSDETSSFDFDSLLTMFMNGSASIFETNKILSESHMSCTDTVEQCLVDSERFYYSTRDRNSTQSSCRLPDWINTKSKTTSDIPRMSNFHLQGMQQSVLFERLLSSLCEFFIEVLLPNDVPLSYIEESETIDKESQDKKRELTSLVDPDLILAISMLWEKKRSTQKSYHVPLSLACNKLCYLVDMYSRHLQLLLKTNGDKLVLEQLEITIKHSLDFCKLVVLSSARHTFKAYIYETLWRLYCSIADEDSSRVLISTILDKYNDAGGWAQKSSIDDSISASGVDENTFSLTSVSSHDILDEEIHFIRTSILFSLCRAFSRGFERVQSPAQKSSLLGLLISSLLKLCQDLYRGFLGQSGGMRKSLFLLYVEAIERCINNIAAIIDMMSVDSVYESTPKFPVLNEATVVIWNIFCEYSLKEAFLVKAILKLSVDSLPVLLRKLESLLDQRIESNMQLMPSVILLERVSVNLTDSLQITSEATKQLDDKSYARGSFTSDKTITKPMDGLHCHVTSLANPKFASPAIVTWACNIALAATSTFWHEFNKSAMTADQKRHPFARKSTDQTILFAKHRITDFQTLHTAICKMFEGIQRPDDNISAENTFNPTNGRANAIDSMTVLAESLSHHGKSYLCSSLEKMSIAFNFSVKSVIGYLKNSSRPDNERLLRSLSCLLGVLSSIVSQSNMHDFITGPVRWFVAETKSFGKSLPNTTDKMGNNAILHRFPKVMYRLESIEAELNNLCIIIRTMKEDNEDHKERMHILNEMASTCTLNGTTDELFYEILKNGIQIIRKRKSSMTTMETYADLLADDEAESVDDDSSVQEKKRNRRFAFARRSRRRMSLRSRNETIDDWLTLDDEDFAAKPGEIYNVDDAFVDLEDFIVDG